MIAKVIPFPRNNIIVPIGTYEAKLTDIQQFQNGYGDRVNFEFTLEGEGVDGETAICSTSINHSPQSKLNNVLRGLLGSQFREVEFSNGIDPEDLIGTECKVSVIQSVNGSGQTYSNVEHVFS